MKDITATTTNIVERRVVVTGAEIMAALGLNPEHARGPLLIIGFAAESELVFIERAPVVEVEAPR